jgi:hypothetical protein
VLPYFEHGSNVLQTKKKSKQIVWKIYLYRMAGARHPKCLLDAGENCASLKCFF